MADADQAAFHYDQDGMKAMSLINAGKSLAFEEVMAWAVDEREGIAENARLHNEACDSERWQDKEPNEAALLRKAIEALREVKEDLGADGEVSQKTESIVRAVLLAAC
jgi:hypothetical protein